MKESYDNSINPAFSERLETVLKAIWENRGNLTHSIIEALEKIADKPMYSQRSSRGSSDLWIGRIND